jgi:predicted ATPase
MILKRLFESFWVNNITVVITSNRPPEDLYLNGLQRFLFMPFIDMINEKCQVINLSSIDYRLLHSMGMDSYYHPIGTPETNEKMQSLWNQLTNNSLG